MQKRVTRSAKTDTEFIALEGRMVVRPEANGFVRDWDCAGINLRDFGGMEVCHPTTLLISGGTRRLGRWFYQLPYFSC